MLLVTTQQQHNTEIKEGENTGKEQQLSKNFRVACERDSKRRKRSKTLRQEGFEYPTEKQKKKKTSFGTQNAQLCSLIHPSMKTFGVYFTHIGARVRAAENAKAIWKLLIIDRCN